MSSPGSNLDAERWLALFLRCVGSVSGLAILGVLMPFAWMDAIHRGLGMGPLPDAPVVAYLARSTSAFYTLLGGLLWTLSLDVRRHRRVLGYMSRATLALGVVLLGTDLAAGMPWWWTLAEGPILLIYGSIQLLLVRRIPPS